MVIHNKQFKLFISAGEIQKKVDELAQRINVDYVNKAPLFVPILNGAFIFAADLLRAVTIPTEISFIRLSSYKKDQSTGKIKELLELQENISNRHVIIVEDIVDTGITLSHLLQAFDDLGAASIETVSLLYKPKPKRQDIALKYIGFTIPNRFVVGYGLDYDGLGRNLKDIYQIN